MDLVERSDDPLKRLLDGEESGGLLRLAAWGFVGVMAVLSGFAAWQYAPPRSPQMAQRHVDPETTGSIAATPPARAPAAAPATAARPPEAAQAPGREVEALRQEVLELRRLLGRQESRAELLSQRITVLEDQTAILTAGIADMAGAGAASRAPQPMPDPLPRAEPAPRPGPAAAAAPMRETPAAPPVSGSVAPRDAQPATAPAPAPGPAASAPAAAPAPQPAPTATAPAAPASSASPPAAVQTPPRSAALPSVALGARTSEPAPGQVAAPPRDARPTANTPAASPPPTPPAASTSPATPSPPPQAAPASPPLPAPAPAVAATTAVAAAPPAAAPRQDVGVDLGGHRNLTQLRKAWSDLAARQPRLVQNITPLAQVRDGDQIELRLVAGPFATAAEAARYCIQAKAAGLACATAPYTGQPAGR